jgi:hypothetical protein
MGHEARPDIRSFPSADEAFAREVRTTAAAGGAAAPEELQRMLRSRFPRAIVHQRELSGEARPTWYVFRDGRAV